MKKLALTSRDALIVMGVLIIPGLLLACFPTLDIAISGYFYDSDHGEFILEYQPFLAAIYRGVPIFSRLLIGGLATCLIASVMIKRLSHWRWPTLFLLLALAIGPGFVVHSVFKNHSGRPRPVHCTEFNGPATFQPAFNWQGTCKSNCSFVSGHASAGFYLTGFAWVWTRYRRRILAIGTLLGLTVGAARVMQGAHFASDVIFCGVVVIGSNLLLAELWRYMMRKSQPKN
jgi:lipid A 4'-phosphatase